MLEETVKGFLQYEIQARPGWGLPTYEVLYVKAYLGSELRKQLSFLAYWKCLKPKMTVNFNQIPFIIYLDKLTVFLIWLNNMLNGILIEFLNISSWNKSFIDISKKAHSAEPRNDSGIGITK